jgi:transcriptional regulator GlxA family with amidase domain
VDVLRNFSGSRRTLENRFRKATGHSVLEEVHAVRLAQAERLLANPQIKIEAIPSLAGYSSANFLARIFKRIHGVSMREFRNREI